MTITLGRALVANINPKRITNTVRAIVEKYSWLLRYVVLGPQSITRAQIKYLIKSGMLMPHMIKMTIGDAYLQAHLDAAKRVTRRSVREYSMKHLRQTAGQYIDKWAEKAATDISGIVQNNLLVHVQRTRDTAKEELAEGVLRNKSAKEIARAIREKTGELSKDWERVVTTELARAQNLGNLDAIIENNVDKPHDEIYVYKTGPHDSKTCKECMRFWFIDGGSTPKVYKLSELVANGSNMGKKKADWKPTVDNTHPNERHFIMELSPGFGFRGGALSYIGRGHNEWKKQNGVQ